MDVYKNLMQVLNSNSNQKAHPENESLDYVSIFLKSDLELFKYDVKNKEFETIFSNRKSNKSKITSLRDFFNQIKSNYSDYFIELLYTYISHVKAVNSEEIQKHHLIAILPFKIGYQFASTKIYVFFQYDLNKAITEIIFLLMPIYTSNKNFFSIEICNKNEKNDSLTKLLRDKITPKIKFTNIQFVILRLVILLRSDSFIEYELNISSKKLQTELVKLQHKICKYFNEDFNTPRESIMFLNQVYTKI